MGKAIMGGIIVEEGKRMNVSKTLNKSETISKKSDSSVKWVWSYSQKSRSI